MGGVVALQSGRGDFLEPWTCLSLDEAWTLESGGGRFGVTLHGVESWAKSITMMVNGIGHFLGG